jgi:diguanylate cyclase (GGDEF)-like protein
MTNLIYYFHKQPKSRLIALGFLILALLGIVDRLIGQEFFFSMFYFIPIFLITWFTKKKIGITISIASAATWLLANYLFYALDRTSPHPVIACWKMGISLFTFLLTIFLLSTLKGVLEQEQKLARLDPLTGTANRRSFIELMEAEINRASRYKCPFTVAHFDLDNFKAVNDRFGHSTGDALLRLVVETVQKNIRVTDTVARLGGDEFAIVLPETGKEAARVVIDKLQNLNGEVMREKGWPVTLSVGVVTFMSPPSTVDEILRLSDALLYEAKNGGKSAIRHKIYNPMMNGLDSINRGLHVIN